MGRVLFTVAFVLTGLLTSIVNASFRPGDTLDADPVLDLSDYGLDVRAVLPEAVKRLVSLNREEQEAELERIVRRVTNAQCRQDIQAGFLILLESLLTEATTPTWLLHMMDSWGKVPSGLFSGNVISSGDFHECVNMKASYNSTEETREFTGSYCGSYLIPYDLLGDNSSSRSNQLKPRDSAQSVEEFLELLVRSDSVFMVPFLGTCLPSTCSLEDQSTFLTDLLVVFRLLPLTVGCHTDTKPPLDWKAILVINSLTLLVGLCVLGTLVDVLDIRRRKKKNKSLSMLHKVLLSFSLYTNFEKVISVEGSQGSMGCIHGIRFMSTAWVLLGHTFYMLIIQQTWNMIDLKHMYGDLNMMPILNGTVSVDTFFVMSGLLVAYNLLRELDKTKGFLNFATVKVPLMYIQRYLRLTPTYLILLAIVATIYPYFSASPLWYLMENDARVCSKNLWHNILYINTLLNYGEGMEPCYGESWYLANDMLYFIASPLVVYPLWLKPIVGMIILAGLSIATLFANFYYLHTKNTIPTFIPSIPNADFNWFYQKPWFRVGPYLIGIFVGYLLYKRSKSQPSDRSTIPRWAVALGWILSTATALAIIFGANEFYYPDNVDLATNSFRALMYGGLHRFAWGCVIAWIIYACVCGHGGIINRILSWEVFVPLGRLSYCIYIAGFHIQLLYHVILMHPVRYSPYIMMHTFFAHLVFNVLVGFILTISIESPFINLTKLLFKRS